AGDLALEPGVLQRERLPAMAGERLHRRAVIPGPGAGHGRWRQRARGGALRNGPPHPRGRTGTGRWAVAARGWRRWPAAEAAAGALIRAAPRPTRPRGLPRARGSLAGRRRAAGPRWRTAAS